MCKRLEELDEMEFFHQPLYGKPGKHVEQSMKDYCANSTECCQETLFKDFFILQEE